MPLTVGGGIRTIEDIRRLLNAGADKVSINTAAVNDHEFVTKAARRFGRQYIVVAIDAKKATTRQHHAVEVFIHGGRTATGLDVIQWAMEVESRGAGKYFSQAWTMMAQKTVLILL